MPFSATCSSLPAPCAGECSALAYDSVTPTQAVGLPMLAAAPVYVSPCVWGDCAWMQVVASCAAP